MEAELQCIKEHLTFIRRDEFSNDTNLELIIIEIKPEKQKSFLVICWYRPPNSSLEIFNDFERVMERIDDLQIPYYILGDINCDVKNKVMSWHTRKLLDILQLYNCSQIIDKYTREAPNSSTTVDLIISNNIAKICENDVIEVSLSDHYMIYCVLGKFKSGKSECHKYKTGRNMKKFNVENFISDMSSVEFDPVYDINDPDRACSAFLSLIMPIIDKHAPLRKTRVRQKESPWMTSDILKLIRNRDNLKQKAKHSKNKEIWDNYKKARNKVTAHIRLAKRKFISTNIKSSFNDVKKMWKTLRYLAPEKKAETETTSIKINGNYIRSQEMANTFNEYFSTIGKSLHSTCTSESSNHSSVNKSKTQLEHRNHFILRDASANEIETIIKNLSVNKATGPDNLPAKLLKHVAATIALPLTHILNQSFRTGSVPDQWKCARVTPIFKGGEKKTVWKIIVQFL